jgi:purine-binding chemotaxis protein CheW
MMHNSAMKAGAATMESEQYLTFRLDGLDYGIPIIKVQEIRGWTKVTSLPNSPRYVKGVLNLRGTIVPILDLRLRFNLNEAAYDAFTVIVVISVGDRLAGVVVDSVSDVISLTSEQRRTPPEFEGQANRQFVQGLAQVDEKLLVLLDVEKLISSDALAEVAEAAA